MGKGLEALLLGIYMFLIFMGFMYHFNNDFFYFIQEIVNDFIRIWDPWYMMPT